VVQSCGKWEIGELKKIYMDLKNLIYIKKNWGFCDPHWILGAIIIYQISAGNNFLHGEYI
jgi:hypothetical protein